jgi:hypothetical protein
MPLTPQDKLSNPPPGAVQRCRLTPCPPHRTKLAHRVLLCVVRDAAVEQRLGRKVNVGEVRSFADADNLQPVAQGGSHGLRPARTAPARQKLIAHGGHVAAIAVWVPPVELRRQCVTRTRDRGPTPVVRRAPEAPQARAAGSCRGHSCTLRLSIPRAQRRCVR